MSTQEIAKFYLSKIPKKDKHYWQTMEAARMRKLVANWLASNNVEPDTKEKLKKLPL